MTPCSENNLLHLTYTTPFACVGANLRVNISDGTACLVGQLVDESSIGHSSRVIHGRANGNACTERGMEMKHNILSHCV